MYEGTKNKFFKFVYLQKPKGSSFKKEVAAAKVSAMKAWNLDLEVSLYPLHVCMH